MNQTVTTEELLALTKSADLLRQTAEKALRCDSLARELYCAKTDRDHLAGTLEKVARVFDGNPDAAPKDFAELPKAVEDLVRENAALKDDHRAMRDRKNRAEERANNVGLQVIALNQRVNELLRENETLARNMPPEPPADTPIVMTYDPASFQTTKVIGQQWCRGNPPEGHIGVAYPGGRLVLCNVHQDTTTGALTYHPVAVKDLPIVQ